MKYFFYILMFSLVCLQGIGQNKEWQTVTIDKYLFVKLPGTYKIFDTLSIKSYNANKDSDVYIVQYVDKSYVAKDAKLLQTALQGAVDGFIKTQKYSQVSIADTAIGGTFGKFVKINRGNLPGHKMSFLYITLANSHFYTIVASSNQFDKVSAKDIIFYYNSVKFDSSNIIENSHEFRNVEGKRLLGEIPLLYLILIPIVALIILLIVKPK